MPVHKTTREDILRRCWEVINLHGYKGSSISMLAKAAGLGKAGLLHHFGSKEDLMHAVLEFSMDFFRDYVLAVATDESLPLEQRLAKMLRRQNRLAKIDQRGCFFTNVIMEMGQEGIHNELLMAFYDEWKQVFARLLGEVLPKGEAKEQAYLMLLQYEGAITLYKLSGDERHLESFVDRYVRIITSTQSSSLNALPGA